jgi:probable phosphoglycerate mutase
VTRLYLVRHGETDWNWGQRIQGHLDIPLNENGRQQSLALRSALAGICPTTVYSSDLARCSETARLALLPAGSDPASPDTQPRVPIKFIPELRERGFGAWQGLTLSEVAARYPDEYACWNRRAPGFAPTDGETWESMNERIRSFLFRVVKDHPGETILAFSHGGPVKTAVAAALEVPSERSLPVAFSNTSVSALWSYPERGWTVAFLNDLCHLTEIRRSQNGPDIHRNESLEQKIA